MNAILLLAQVYEGSNEWKKAGFARTSFKFDQHRSDFGPGPCPRSRSPFHSNCTASTEKKLEWYIDTAVSRHGRERAGLDVD